MARTFASTDRERLTSSPGSSISAQDLYDDYCDWCLVQGRHALAMPVYCRELKTLGVRKGTLRPQQHARRRVYYLDVEIGEARTAWHE